MNIVDRLIQRVGDWRENMAIARLLKANPNLMLGVSRGRGDTEKPPQDPKLMQTVFEKSEFVYVAATVIAQAISSAPLIGEELVSVDGNMVWQRIKETHALAEVLRKPNDDSIDDSIQTLEWRTTLNLLSPGNGYWLTLKDEPKQEIHFVDPSWTKVIADKSTGGVAGYEVERNGKTNRFEKDDMVHFRWPNHRQSLYGFSPLTAAAIPIQWQWHGGTYVSEFFRDGAIPGGVLSYDRSLTPEDKAESRKELDRLYKGRGRRHKNLVLDRGTGYTIVTSPLKDLIVRDLFTLSREYILAIMGVPPGMAGIMEFANYANLEAQERIFWLRMLPIMQLIEGALNSQWVGRFGKNLRVRHDVSQVKALQKDQKAAAERATKIYVGGLATKNESRNIIGLDPIPGGDEFIVSPRMGNSGGNEGESGTASRSSLKTVGKDADPRRVKWAQHYKAVTTAEDRFNKVMDRFFRDQSDRVLEALDDLTSTGKNGAALWLLVAKDDELTPDAIQAIFDLDAENALLIAATKPTTSRTITEAGSAAMRAVSVGLTFNVENPQVVVMLNGFDNRIVGVNDATFEDIKKILRQGFEDGIPLEKVSKNIRDQYGQYITSTGESGFTRSRRIAKTEMNGAINGGAKAGYTQAGVEKLEWMSAFLADSRQTHMDADGQVIKIGGNFDVGGEALRFPSDPNGSPGNTINCYCSINPVD